MDLGEDDTFDFDPHSDDDAQAEKENRRTTQKSPVRTKPKSAPTVEIVDSKVLSNFFDNFIVAKNRFKMTTELLTLYSRYHAKLTADSNSSKLTFTNELSPDFTIPKLSALSSYHTADYLKTLGSEELARDLLNECSFLNLPQARQHLLEIAEIQIDPESSKSQEESDPESVLSAFARLVAATTIAAAQSLCDLSKNTKTAINWYGGWHHSHPNRYSGFCFINDIIFGIEALLTCYNRILYIDLDVHHGDAVENHYRQHSRVLTLSVHKHHPGFFPGTGSRDLSALENTKIASQNHADEEVAANPSLSEQALNLAFSSNVSSEEWRGETCQTLKSVTESFGSFDALVVLCGADALRNDPLNGGFRVELRDYLYVVRQIHGLNLPTLMLGGGGYRSCNAARLWTLLTLQALDPSLETLKKMPMGLAPNLLEDFYPEYKSSYRLDTLS